MKPVFASTLAVFAFAAAGCGGTPEPETTSEPQLPAAAQAQADECTRAQMDMAKAMGNTADRAAIEAQCRKSAGKSAALEGEAEAAAAGASPDDFCMVLADAGRKLCGQEAVAWCESTAPMREQKTGDAAADKMLASARESCDEVTEGVAAAGGR